MPNYTEGRLIFTNRCESCHSINKRLVGPALRDVDKRRTDKWIIDFVHSSQTIIKSGDTAAVALFNEFGKTIMPDHTDLKAEQIQNIIAYIKEQSQVPLKQTSSIQPFNKPYKNKNSLLDQVIYLNFESNYTPLKATDYGEWFLIAIILIMLILLLYVKVLKNIIRDRYVEWGKVKEEKNDDNVLSN